MGKIEKYKEKYLINIAMIVYLILIGQINSCQKQNVKEIEKIHVSTFKNQGCITCHNIEKPSTFTHYGEQAKDKHYGCISMLNYIKTHNFQDITENKLKKLFTEHKCSTCHDINGEGQGRENLTSFGINMKNKNLGCVSIFTSLIKESNN